MLKEIFTSQPLYYYTRDTYKGPWQFNMDYQANIDPYIETLSMIKSIFVHGTPNRYSPNTLYVNATFKMSPWPSWVVTFHKFDCLKGSYLARVAAPSSVGTLLSFGATFRSKLGKLWARHMWGFTLQEFMFTESSVALGDMTLASSFFPGLFGFGFVAIDDDKQRFLNGRFRDLTVHNLQTGALLDTLYMPDNISAVALEDSGRAYVLCANRVLVLVDYTRHDILGVVQIPPAPGGSGYWNDGDVSMTWDHIFRRILIIEAVPDNADGSCATVVRGYRMVPLGTRITTPIPLEPPRKGRVIPVLAQVVGELNEGVGGYIITAEVTGEAAQVGVPMTTSFGEALIRCDCKNAGEATVNCTAQLPADITVIVPEDLGETGSTPPADPGGGEDQGDYPPLPSEVCATLNAERAKFPDIITSLSQLGEILIRTAWAHRADTWGLSRKSSGNRVDTAVGPIAVDILHRQSDNMMFDVIHAAGVGYESDIQCGRSIGPQNDLEDRPWVAPVDLG